MNRSILIFMEHSKMAKTNKSDQNYCKSTFDLNQKVKLRPKLAFILIKY